MGNACAGTAGFADDGGRQRRVHDDKGHLLDAQSPRSDEPMYQKSAAKRNPSPSKSGNLKSPSPQEKGHSLAGQARYDEPAKEVSTAMHKSKLNDLTTAELSGRMLMRFFFLFECFAYVGFSISVLFILRDVSGGFPLYLPKAMLDDPIAMDYFRVAVVAVCMIGLGYLPMALNNMEEVMWASIFNKVAIGIQASVGYYRGILPTSIYLLVMVVDLGTALITAVLAYTQPGFIRESARKLLWTVHPKANRTSRSYAFETEGYILMLFYVVLALKPVAQSFAAAEAERVGYAYEGIKELEGYRLGMFQIASFWMGVMYWFYIPAARCNSKGFMANARLQRLGILVLWTCINLKNGEVEHNLFNTIAIFALGFLALDIYCDIYDRHFRSEHAQHDDDFDGAPSEDYALFRQPELSLKAKWVAVNSVMLYITSSVWMFFSSSGLPYLFHKCLPGYEELAYKLHLQDLFVSVFMPLIAVFLFPLVPKTRTARMVLTFFTFWMPWSAWWFTTESKLLMHVGGGTPFHMSWVTMQIGTKFTEITTDITFFFATVGLTVVTPALLVIVALLFQGSPFTAFRDMDGATTAADVAVYMRRIGQQQMTLLVAFTGGWMIVVSSGLPMPTKWLTELAAVPPLLPVDTRKAVQVHRYDLVLGFCIPVVAWMLCDAATRNINLAKRCMKVTVFSAWFYTIAVKVACNAGATPAFHRSWVDMYNSSYYTSPAVDVLSWLAFVMLNFVAFPYLVYTMWPLISWTKVFARNPGYARQTTVETLQHNRGIYYTHALLMVASTGLWMLATSSGFLWPLDEMVGANIDPVLPSFAKPNPSALRVQMQDLMFALTWGIIGIFLDYVPLKLTGQREEITWYTFYGVWFTWSLSIWAKVMVNLSEDDMPTWPGVGAFGEWRTFDARATEHNFVDIVWYATTILGRVIAPMMMFWTARNVIGSMAYSLRKHERTDRDNEEEEEMHFMALLMQLIGRFVEGTGAYRALAGISRILSPPEQEFLTVDRIAYAMQEPSKTLRRKHFYNVGISRDKNGWWHCSKVPEEVDQFQRNEILPAMEAHTIQKAPSTFFEIIRTRAFNAAPAWMVWQPLTDELFDDIFHSRFGAECLRKPTKDELKEYHAAFKHVPKRGNRVVKSGKMTLSKAIHRVEATPGKAGSLCVVDTRVFLEGAQRKDDVYYTPGIRIFFTCNKHGIQARLIACEDEDGNQKYYENDGTETWHFAKRLAMTAVITMHQIGVHLVHGHLLIESQVVLAYKHLNPKHWLFHFMEPLAGDVQFINRTWGLDVIVYGTIMDMGPVTSEGLLRVIDNAETTAFEKDYTWSLMKRMDPAYCGVPEDCPFNYRFTVRILEGYVRNFCKAIVDKYFDPDDDQLKAFMKSCYWWRSKPATTPVTKEAIVDYMVEFYLNASYRHDYAHDDYLWRVAKALPPQLLKDADPESPSSYLPSKDTYAMVLQIAHALQAGVIETPIEAYPTLYARTDLEPAVIKFVANVQGLLVLHGAHEHMNQCGSMTH